MKKDRVAKDTPISKIHHQVIFILVKEELSPPQGQPSLIEAKEMCPSLLLQPPLLQGCPSSSLCCSSCSLPKPVQACEETPGLTSNPLQAERAADLSSQNCQLPRLRQPAPPLPAIQNMLVLLPCCSKGVDKCVDILGHLPPSSKHPSLKRRKRQEFCQLPPRLLCHRPCQYLWHAKTAKTSGILEHWPSCSL